MNYRKKTACAAAVAAVVLLAACSGRTGETVASGEMAVPELSSEDLIVSSLEYLLQDENERDISVRGQDESAAQDTDADRDPAAAEDASAQPEDDSHADVVIYYGNGASHELNRETVKVEELLPEELVSALVKHNIVSLDTKVLSFVEEQRETGKVLHLDLSRAAGEYIRTMSGEAECIIVASIANTFLENYDADAIRLTVEGKALTSAHRAYEEELSRCTPEELLDALKAGGQEDADGAGSVSEDTM